MKRVKLLLTAFALFIAMGTPNVMAQGTKVSQPSINLVGKWLWPNPKFYFEFSSDGTGTYRVHQGKEYKLGDTEYTYVVEAWLLYINWKLDNFFACTKYIGEYAFSSCKKVASIKFHLYENLVICSYAFYQCLELTEIDFSDFGSYEP